MGLMEWYLETRGVENMFLSRGTFHLTSSVLVSGA